ncbi:MAG: FG-GAP-like repeat-containing protein [Planctomycetota bacterium]
MRRFTVSTACLVVLVTIAQPLAAQLSFTDATATAGLGNTYTSGPFPLSEYCGGGAAGDFNGDGFQDIYVPSDGLDPDRLFLNNGDGTFTDAAAAWGLTELHYGKGPAIGDYDNDGDVDIYVTSVGDIWGIGPGKHRLYRNDGNTFTNVASAAGVNFTHPTAQDGLGSCFGDYDLDGDLDLFVCGFSNNNDGSKLFRNDGNGAFTDVTVASQLFANVTNTLLAFSPRFLDIDGDRYPELYVVADFGDSLFFKNNGDGTFTDVTTLSGVGQEENGMGQTIGDFDGNGLLDWYVTSIYLPAGSWTGNKLYLNQGAGLFTETAQAAGVDDGAYGWAAIAVDFDHDGDVDIAETNGAVAWLPTPSYLWRNNGTGTSFSEDSTALGFVHVDQGRGMIHLDVDNDGDQEIVVFTRNSTLAYFRNDLVAGTGAAWLRVFLDNGGAPTVAPHGIGARITATIGATTHVRTIDSGDGFLSKSELSAHFGLAGATVIDQLTIDWPNGVQSVFTAVPVDQTLTVTYSITNTFVRGNVNGDTGVDIGDAVALLAQLFQTPPASFCMAAADANEDGSVNIADAVFLLTFLFTAGPAPTAPYPNCEATVGALPCDVSGC